MSDQEIILALAVREILSDGYRLPEWYLKTVKPITYSTLTKQD